MNNTLVTCQVIHVVEKTNTWTKVEMKKGMHENTATNGFMPFMLTPRKMARKGEDNTTALP